MAKIKIIELEDQKQKALLVAVELFQRAEIMPTENSLDELAQLAETAGVDVAGVVVQNLRTPNPKTFVGSGKVEEIKILAQELETGLIIFDNELSPRHQRELEKEFGDQCQVIDRTALILDIFAQHANTREGSLQVELAQYEYRLPRLTRAWTHLARQAGGGAGRTGSVGGVGLRGPGETQLEVDRRLISNRIEFLKNELEKVRAHRSRHRERRKKTRIPVVSLVGYTNSGKSTLLNKLTDADVYIANQLFATLDPTTRRVELPGGHFCLFTDTVGFIQKLPTELVAAFRATLEEIAEADILLHIVDITHKDADIQIKSVQQTLVNIGAGDIPMITAYNKIDLLDHTSQSNDLTDADSNVCQISALTGQGLDSLLLSIEKVLFETYIDVELLVPYDQGQLLSLLHEKGQVSEVINLEEGMRISGFLPRRWVPQVKHFLVNHLVNFLEEDEDL